MRSTSFAPKMAQAVTMQEVTLSTHRMESQNSPKSEKLSGSVSYNKISHQPSARDIGMPDIQIGDYGRQEKLKSIDHTQYTLNDSPNLSNVKASDKLLQKQKINIHLQSQFSNMKASTTLGSTLQTQMSPLKFMGRQVPIKGANSGLSGHKSRFGGGSDFNSTNNYMSATVKPKRQQSSSKGKRIQLAALFP